MSRALLGMRGTPRETPAWLIQAARQAAAQAPAPSPELVARLAVHMGWVPAPAPLAAAS